jgi:hypothetical protein
MNAARLIELIEAGHFFAALGKPISAGVAQLRTARRLASSHLHPDRNPDPRANAALTTLNASLHQIINAPNSKAKDKAVAAYTGRAGFRPCEACNATGGKLLAAPTADDEERREWQLCAACRGCGCAPRTVGSGFKPKPVIKQSSAFGRRKSTAK